MFDLSNAAAAPGSPSSCSLCSRENEAITRSQNHMSEARSAMQGRSHGCRKPWQVRWLSQCAPESDCNDVEHEEALVGMSTRRIRTCCEPTVRIIQSVPPSWWHSEWYGRAEDDVLKEQSDGAPSGGVGEHAVGSRRPWRVPSVAKGRAT